MTDFSLTQSEADALIALEKHRVDEARHDFPVQGEALIIPMQSADRREQFLLDLRRGRIDVAKVTFQNRARQVIVLARLDLAGRPHRNPDDEEIPCPHLHVYREGFGTKWAIPLPRDAFTAPGDMWQTYQEFLRYCNITRPPHVDRGLFT